MIHSQCFTNKWIDVKKDELGLRDPGLLEKCIYALQLLGLLAESNIPFVFKGGTAMVLLLERLRRLSIDIDIVSESPDAVDLSFLQNLTQNSAFLRVEEDQRGSHRLPHRRHFKFFYTSIYSSKDSYVLLDVLQEGNLYLVTQHSPICASFIETERMIKVTLPTVDSLLADKLTAFAPNTVGVELTADSNMRVIKQVVDIGELFERATDMTLIQQTYTAICDAEIGYRGNICTRNEALEDTIRTSLQICEVRLKPQDKATPLFDAGRRRIENHLIGPTLSMDNLKVAAARAAAIAALILNPSSPLTLADLRYDSTLVDELKLAKIGLSLPLNRLRQVNPEAFFYWYKIDTLLR